LDLAASAFINLSYDIVYKRHTAESTEGCRCQADLGSPTRRQAGHRSNRVGNG